MQTPTPPSPPPAGKPPALRLDRQILLIAASLAALATAWALANGYLQQLVRAERAEAALALDSSLRTLDLALVEQVRQLEDELPRGRSAHLERLTGGGAIWLFGYDGTVTPLAPDGAPPDALTRRAGLAALSEKLAPGELAFLPVAQAAPGNEALRFAIPACRQPPCRAIAVGTLTPWPLMRATMPSLPGTRLDFRNESGQHYGGFRLGETSAGDNLPLWQALLAPGLAAGDASALTLTRPLAHEALLLEASLPPGAFVPPSPWRLALPIGTLAIAALTLALLLRMFQRLRLATFRLEQLEQGYLLMNTSNMTLRERLQKLTASQRDLQTLIDTVQVGVLILDADRWQIRACNQRAGELFGRGANDLAGLPGERLFANDTDLSICRTLIAQGMPVIDRDICLLRENGTPFWSLLSMRGLFHNGQPAVAISVVDVTERIAHAEQLATEKQATEHAMRQLQSVQDELVALATLDDLTGIANRRHFMKSAGACLEAALHDARPLAVLMLDIDHFKQVNDTLGHDAGDAILNQTVTLSRTLIRQHDVFGRIGGEEFCLVLPDADEATALGIADRIRERIASHPFHAGGQSRRVTVSIGLAAWRPGADTAPPALAPLLKSADEALYRAKAQGRNQVVCAREVHFLKDGGPSPAQPNADPA